MVEDDGSRSRTSVSTDQMFSCGQCDFSYTTIKQFMSHVKSVADHQPVCVECDSKFQNFDNLRHHLRKYHFKAGEVVCKECGKVSRSEDQQYQHWNYVHKVEADLFCNLCGAECQNMFKLRQHTKKCLTKDPVKIERDRRENESLNRSREQVVTWSYSKYTQYKTDLQREKENSKQSNCHQKNGDYRRRKVKTKSDSTFYETIELSEERQEGEQDSVKKFKSDSRSQEEGSEPGDIDIDKLLEVKYEADSDLEESEKTLDANLNNNEEETVDWMNGGKDEEMEEEEEEEEYEDNESNFSDEESFHPTDFLQFQTEAVKAFEVNGDVEDSSDRLNDYRFQCDECRETFKSLSTLKRHKREEHSGEFDESQRNFQCPICPDSFYCEQTLRRHKRKHHPDYKGDPKYSCSECEEKFYKYLAFRDHLREAHKLMGEEEDSSDKMFKCPSCTEAFFSESSLKRHRRKFHPETLKNVGRRNTPEKTMTWPCNECEEVLRSQSTLKKHKKLYHQKKKKCNMCEEMVYNLPQHRLDVHPEIMAATEGAMAANGMCVCPYCSKQIATQQHLESHIKRMHEELLLKSNNAVLDSLYCVECGTHFENARAVRLHRKQTHDRHLYVKVCPHCAKEVMNLQKHIRDAHPDPNDDKDWPCKDCDQVFKTTRDLRYHRAKLHEKVRHIAGLQ